jgi:hypothetical protein
MIWLGLLLTTMMAFALAHGLGWLDERKMLMTATKKDIEDWYAEAVKCGATHLIIGHDPFDHDNFPIYIMPGQSVRDRIDGLLASGNRYDEVYDLKLSKAKQFAEHRAMHIPEDSKKVKP